MEVGEEDEEEGEGEDGNKSKEEIIVNHNGNSNFVNEMLEQMEVNADGEKTCPICRRVLKVHTVHCGTFTRGSGGQGAHCKGPAWTFQDISGIKI